MATNFHLKQNDKIGANNISFVISDYVCNNKIQTEKASFRNEIGAINSWIEASLFFYHFFETDLLKTKWIHIITAMEIMQTMVNNKKNRNAKKKSHTKTKDFKFVENFQ